MYYPSSENTGADQLRGYREADLRLCFRIGNYPVFSRRGSYVPEFRINKCTSNSKMPKTGSILRHVTLIPPIHLIILSSRIFHRFDI